MANTCTLLACLAVLVAVTSANRLCHVQQIRRNADGDDVASDYVPNTCTPCAGNTYNAYILEDREGSREMTKHVITYCLDDTRIVDLNAELLPLLQCGENDVCALRATRCYHNLRFADDDDDSADAGPPRLHKMCMGRDGYFSLRQVDDVKQVLTSVIKAI